MVYRCNTLKEKACTSCCCLGLLLLACATILVHGALGTLLPAVVNLPENVEKGLNEVLNFGALEADVDQVKVEASDALAKCGITAPAAVCNNPPTNNPLKVDSDQELQAIKQIFDKTLKTVKQVTGDKYLGLAEFQSADNQLTKIQSDLRAFDNFTMPIECGATNSLYCGLYLSSAQIKDSMSPIKEGIQKITDNEAIKEFKKNSDYLKYLHALPYIMWLGMAFYLCFFVSEKATSTCRGGSCKACAACCGHGIFFIISLVVAVVVVAAGIFIVGTANTRRLEGSVVGSPTPAELIDHLKVAFPGFYDVVLKNLLEGLKKFFDAQVIFIVADVVILVHTCTTCCLAPYAQKGASFAEP